ncbi:hypothetical protein J2T12_002853 [Paenibacillus anaericanus]|uniref:aspartyl-phosphate phosphatase Spo0E family protein n=1 Tax=Paenibacillus anaericanus TaxID=170367 RepID=UPI00277E0CE5|nr:aspartyl-phosphate phosphatase Spo0E family protein [Paenibacillus anaericanus]MDQ0089441.1 hypothetical protein [Paenibacillus anaericanus]
MNKSKAIRTRIEIARQKLNKLADQYGLTDCRVMEQSVLLDELINTYNHDRYDNYKNKLFVTQVLITADT